MIKGACYPALGFDDLVKRKMFVVSSFEIHGGVSGLFDLGPPSCALKVCMFGQPGEVAFEDFPWCPSCTADCPCLLSGVTG